jgi:hypothetical protein
MASCKRVSTRCRHTRVGAGFLAVAALPRTAIGTLLCRKLQDLHRTLNARQQASSVESMERQAIESG